MQSEIEEGELLTKYLLGELTEDEEAGVERRLFADNKFFEQLLAAESSLIDEYASGGLSLDVRERVEKLIKSAPQQQRELDFSKQLIAAFSASGVEKTGAGRTTRWRSLSRRPITPLRASLAFSALLVLVSFYLLLWGSGLKSRIRELQDNLAVVKTEKEQAAETIAQEQKLNRKLREELDLKRQEPTQESGAGEIASLLLTPDYVVRGNSQAPKIIKLDPAAGRLRIQVDLKPEDAYKRFRVLIKTFGGKEVWNNEVRPSTRADAKRFIVTLPLKFFPADDYILTVKGSLAGEGFVDIEDYSFGVRR